MKKGPSRRRQGGGGGGKKSWILWTASYSLTSVSSWVMQSVPTFDWCFCLVKWWKQTGESEGRDWVLTPQDASSTVGQWFPELSFSIYKVGIKCLSPRLVKALAAKPNYLSSVTEQCMAEGKNPLWQVVPWPPCMHCDVHAGVSLWTHIHTINKCNKKS